MATLAAQLAHAKAKWDAELARWNEIQGAVFNLEQQRRRQQERVHESYMAYQKLRDQP